MLHPSLYFAIGIDHISLFGLHMHLWHFVHCSNKWHMEHRSRHNTTSSSNRVIRLGLDTGNFCYFPITTPHPLQKKKHGKPVVSASAAWLPHLDFSGEGQGKIQKWCDEEQHTFQTAHSICADLQCTGQLGDGCQK